MRKPNVLMKNQTILEEIYSCLNFEKINMIENEIKIQKQYYPIHQFASVIILNNSKPSSFLLWYVLNVLYSFKTLNTFTFH